MVGGKASKVRTGVMSRPGTNQLKFGCCVSSASRVPKCKIPIVKISLARIEQQRREKVESDDEIDAVKSRTEMAYLEAEVAVQISGTRWGEN